MKVDKQTVKTFEHDQRLFGTEVALINHNTALSHSIAKALTGKLVKLSVRERKPVKPAEKQ